MANRQFYKTEGEKVQFIHERFQLDTNAILIADAKLKEAVSLPVCWLHNKKSKKLH